MTPPRWGLLDLQYTYLDDGFTLVATTDVPCHLFARMTTTPPRKHSKPTNRRGLNVAWDIRFCFVVYEDNEQAEAGDTLTHTFVKDAWPVCETRWFYFLGTIGGTASPSETAIFEFHFPAPPPEPPPPILHQFAGGTYNRTIQGANANWGPAHDAATGTVLTWDEPPTNFLYAWSTQTVLYRIRRAYLVYDTSTLPATALVQSADVDLFIAAATPWPGCGLQHIFVTRGVQQLPVLPSDYGAQLPHTTILGELFIRDLVVGQYNHIPLNPAGLEEISLTGLTKFCVRIEYDVDDIAPPRLPFEVQWYSAQKGAGYRPTLTVHYYPA